MKARIRNRWLVYAWRMPFTRFLCQQGFIIDELLDKGLELLNGQDPEQVITRAKALFLKGKGAGWGFELSFHDEKNARNWLKESIELYRSSDDRAGLGLALNTYGRNCGIYESDLSFPARFRSSLAGP